jgi:hypothetical protein
MRPEVPVVRMCLSRKFKGRIVCRITLITPVLLLLVLGGTGYAGSGSLQGIVRGPDGAGIAGAVLSLINGRSEVAGRATTSVSGGYAMRAVPPCTYRLAVEAPGFAGRVFESVLISPSRRAGFDVRLQNRAVVLDPDSVYRLSALSQLLVEVELYHDILKQPAPAPKPQKQQK